MSYQEMLLMPAFFLFSILLLSLDIFVSTWNLPYAQNTQLWPSGKLGLIHWGLYSKRGKRKAQEKRNRQTEVETKRQTNEPIVRETNGQTDKHSERETNRHTYKERERERQIERRTKYSKKVPTYGTWNYVNRDLYNMSSELFCFES